MKRAVPAAVLLALIILLCILSNITVSKSIKKAKSEISKCQTLYSNSKFQEAEKCAYNFKKHWLKETQFVSLYSNHCPLDDITTLAATLPEAVKTKNDFEFYSTVERIATILDAIYKEQSFSFEKLY